MKPILDENGRLIPRDDYRISSLNCGGVLPLRVQNENTFRGHLMLTFMATAILQRLQRDIIPQEPVKDINAIYKLLGIECPVAIARDG